MNRKGITYPISETHPVLEAYREMIPAMLRQQRDPGYYVERVLPATANPSVAAAPARGRPDRPAEMTVAAA